MAVRFCRGAPIVFLGVVKWYHSWFGAMWRGFDSLHRDQFFGADGIIGNTVALQVTVGGSIPPRSTNFLGVVNETKDNRQGT